MSRPVTVRLAHTRPYAWTARAADERSRALLGDDPIAVLRVVGGQSFFPAEGRFSYGREPEATTGGWRPDWWFKEDQGEWRAGLAPGAFLAARRHEEDGTPNGRAGRWIGVYRIREVSLGKDAMEIRADPERVAEVRP